MRQWDNWLPLRGRWLGYAACGVVGFAVTQITTQYAIVCFTPAVIMSGLFYWSAFRKGDWRVTVAFVVGFACYGIVTWQRFLEVMRHID